MSASYRHHGIGGGDETLSTVYNNGERNTLAGVITC